MKRLLILAAVCLLSSCAGEQEEPASRSFTAEGGQPGAPLAATIRVDTDELTIADTLRVEIETVSEQGWLAEIPELGKKLEMFGLSDYGTIGPQVGPDGKTRIINWYKLEPFFSGEHIVPELEIKFLRDGDAGPEEQVLVTSAIPITVKSLVGEDRKQLDDLNPVKDVVDLPTIDPWLAAAIAAMCLAAVVAAVSAGIHWAGQRPEEQAEPDPPHVIALRRLEELKKADLIGQGLIDEFYVRLSDIIRRYIEDKFGLKAPERTTEEFLADVSTGNALKDTGLLTDFLTHCDLVKFAAHEPTGNEIEVSFESARLFIEATRAHE